MRLKPKHLGDELTLDEFNAIQHLLYNMTFNDTLYLEPEKDVKKTWATYTYQEHEKFVLGKYDTYELTEDLTESDKYIFIKLSEEINGRSTYYATIYYLEDETIDGLERVAVDSIDVMDELKRPDLSEKRDYKNISVKCIKEKIDNTTYLKIPLYQTVDNSVLGIKKAHSLLSRNIELEIRFNEEHYVDVNNGKANQSDEILIQYVQRLEKMIRSHPTDGEKAIYRLDANRTFTPSSTMQIKNGMNIEIRGGTNGGNILNDNSNRVILDASTCGRLFLVKPGGKLVLRDVQLINANSKQSSYNKGYGGTILVEKNDKTFGQLECINTIFKDSTANHGGAIYSEHAGIYLDTCRFTNCTSTTNGGAVEYISESIIMTFNNITGKRGDTITFKVTVKEEDNEPVDQGSVHFYIGNTEIGVGTVVNGVATLDYTIPETLSVSEQIITAVYDGGQTNETAYIQATLFITDPTKLSFTMNNITVTEVGTVVKLQVTSVDQNGKTNTSGTGLFTIDGTEYPATVENGKYVCDFTIPSYGYKQEYSVIFKVTNRLCTPITRKITVIPSYITGIYLNDATINQELINKWVNNGITDVYVRCNDFSIDVRKENLLSVLKYAKGKNIRVHGAINCFYDAYNLQYITPSDSRVNWLKENIQSMIENTDISGVVLDYMIYPGTTANENNHTTITKYFKQLYEHIKALDENMIVSGCVTCDTSKASSHYGQNYKEIAPYVTYMMPMIYKGNNGTNGTDQPDTWVTEKINTIKSQIDSENINADEKVIPNIQTYTNDTDLQNKIKNKNMAAALRSKANLEATMKAIIKTNVKGVVLFREGLISTYPSSFKQLKEGT